MSHSDRDEQQQTLTDFGRALAETRKSRNYSVAEISRHLKIPEHIIEAIEGSDLETLPVPIYTQGYIRAYAKFLEMSEEDAIAAYNRAMPHDLASDLKPRTGLPAEHSSQSPMVKMVTVLLIVAGLFVLVYGVVQYYQEKASDMALSQQAEDNRPAGSSLDAPSAQPTPGAAEEFSRTLDTEDEVESLIDSDDSGDTAVDEEPVVEIEEEPTVTALDTLEILAEKGAWLEVYDDTNARLFYNLVKKGETKTLTGSAPFRIKVGNADITRVLLNGIEVDLSGHTRRNNTAVFTISERDGNIIYH